VKKLHAWPPALPTPLLHAAQTRPVMRTYLSFPRGARIPSPRILFYAGDEPGQARRDFALATTLTEEFPTGSVVLVTGAVEATVLPGAPRVEIVKLPSLPKGVPPRPLARERIRRLRERLLRTLFDVFLPDLVLLDMDGPEAEHETRLLLLRARALGSATLIGVRHDGPEARCGDGGAADACLPCRHRIRSAAREALSRRLRGREL
jgi:predicted glycosyltransferase